ncbi:nuclear transport factor 2 family protein [uncultured Bacteroides sp.]|uniref:nuclear transport factor 2 family protein n=1 Tax=uncultured Bacteroides sp. TaxID=162156 RepID=UPI0025CBAA97|nr:nuclear transport factor 2 family protein [uncultured Bacteroides sp.]
MRNLIATIVLVAGSWLTTAAQIPAAEVADRMALKELVDTFSNLADVKDVDAQMTLFTNDAEVHSKSGDRVSVMKGKEQIGKAFANYLALFDVVYHLNGQQTVEIKGNEATGISYCFVTLIGGGKKNQSGVRYRDTYVKVDGKWLIKKRESNFMFTTVEDFK